MQALPSHTQCPRSFHRVLTVAALHPAGAPGFDGAAPHVSKASTASCKDKPKPWTSPKSQACPLMHVRPCAGVPTTKRLPVTENSPAAAAYERSPRK